MNLIFPLISFIFYIVGLYGIPWAELLPKIYPFSSYVWDTIFVLFLFIVLGKEIHFKKVKLRIFLLTSIFIAIFALLVGLGIAVLGIGHPFNQINELFLIAIILAPLYEELIFRHFFLKNKWKVFSSFFFISTINGLIYGFYHLVPAFFTNQNGFTSFTIYQSIYSSILGFILAYFQMKHHHLFMTWFHHLLFNSVIVAMYYLRLF